ncbi:type II toxin-antitoxin system VapC family toxin [Candidatus Halobeggiatoa sp. HSG11]|nr:type II toxin-antitoxin system VapC family toxin [Candidatus Halobeggiatoa sp. HSG11]
MNYLLDTCFLSEIRKPKINTRVLNWLNNVDEQCLYISTVSICEIQQGISQLKDPVFQQNLTKWLDEILLPWFEDRIISVDVVLARRWGSLLGQFAKKGLTRPVMDTLIAASAEHHKLTLVTRNIIDFELFEIKLHDPWDNPSFSNK